ncbi:MAG TPA: Ig-like domain repeat protein [Acidobacteriaceae bacterium]|nr:Ig-like domain repeat protein [Acidobacteriaceae bacterium]
MSRARFESRFCCTIVLLAMPALAAAQNNLFTTVTPSTVAAAPNRVATGDFNGDGIMDMAVTVPSQDVVDVFIGTGDGNFGSPVSYAAGTNPWTLVAGDFNHDGHLDLAVTNALTNGHVSILFGKGDGTFDTNGGTYLAGVFPYAIGSGDFDGDGNLDLAVINFGQTSTPGSVTILLGKPGGTFQFASTYTFGAYPATIAVGDFTGDGKPDLAVGFAGPVGSSLSQVQIFTNGGGGSFQASALLAAPVPDGIASITAGDFDGDGKLDLAAVSAFARTVTVFHGRGDGNFDAVPASPSIGAGPQWIAAGDVNGDGKVDLVSANLDGTVSVLLGNGDDTFTSNATYQVGNQPVMLALADLNGDGKLDVTVVNSGDDNVQVLLGKSDGTFFTGSFQVGANPGGIAAGDFNGDGFADLAVAKGDATVAIFLGDGRGAFKALNPFPACQGEAGYGLGKIVAADVNGDNKVDLAVVCNSTTTGSSFGTVFQGNGDGTFTTALGAPGNSQGMIAADINGDGVPEFITASGGGIIAFNLSPAFVDIVSTAFAPGGVAAGDFNGDGKTDLLAIGSGATPGVILLGDGLGNFQQDSVLGWPGGLTGDFNGDGLTDFLNYQPSDLVQVILNQGNGTFLSGTEIQGNPIGRPQALADFNGDGALDVLTAFHSGAPLNVFLGHGDGTFDQQPAVSLSQLGMATVAVGDFDANGSPDVAALDSSTGTVSILLNRNSFQSTVTTLTGPATKAVVGQSFTLSATVSSKQGTPTGNVTFKQAGVPQTTGSLNNGKAQATLSAPSTVGTFGFTALYTGDGTFGGSVSQRLLLSVSVASSTTVVSSSNRNSKLGQSVTLTATVSPQFSGVPTGTVAFYADGQPIGSGGMSGGQASVSISTLAEGSHIIEADYSGDTNFTTSLGRVTQKVGTASSAVTLASSLNPAVYGQPVTLTATVTDSAGTAPTGMVVFSEAGTIYGSVTLSGGMAQLTLPQLLVGKHAIIAQYSGDSSDAPSKATLTETIQGASSSTAITSSLNPSNYGQAVVFTATVTSTAGSPDGTVTFKNGTQGLGTVTLSGGQAQLSVTTIDAGAHTIKAVYNGSNTYTTSQNSLQQVVVAAPTTVTLTGSPNPASLGQSVTFTATVNCATATPVGTVSFKDGKTALGTATVVNGQAQISTSLLTKGGHTLTATYSGSADFSKSSGAVSQAVQ